MNNSASTKEIQLKSLKKNIESHSIGNKNKLWPRTSNNVKTKKNVDDKKQLENLSESKADITKGEVLEIIELHKALQYKIQGLEEKFYSF